MINGVVVQHVAPSPLQQLFYRRCPLFNSFSPNKQKNANDCQTTLSMAAGSLALQGKLNVGVISENIALSTVPYSRTAPAWPRSSPLLAPGPVHFVHYNAFTPKEEHA